MDITMVGDLIPILQVAVGPVILISGVGLLVLSMTNRLGRAIDRTRTLADLYAHSLDADQPRLREQLVVLWRRAKILRLAITLATASALCAALLVIDIFITALWMVSGDWVIVVLFSTSLVSLVIALILFIHDINQSLAALRVEMDFSLEINSQEP
jgi:hypothetical protein